MDEQRVLELTRRTISDMYENAKAENNKDIRQFMLFASGFVIYQTLIDGDDYTKSDLQKIAEAIKTVIEDIQSMMVAGWNLEDAIQNINRDPQK